MNVNIEILRKQDLFDLCFFVVKQNYEHHTGDSQVDYIKEVKKVYEEELEYFEDSITYVAKCNDEVCGCIRILKHRKGLKLPIEKLFSIDPTIHSGGSNNIWHIGRFAIAKGQSFLLFKTLMTYALQPVCCTNDSYLYIECDKKLSKVLSLLSIEYQIISSPIDYLGSITLPIKIEKKGLDYFFNKNKKLILQTTTLKGSIINQGLRLPMRVA